MNVDERLLNTKSRYVIPIEKVSFEKSSNGVGVSIKTKRVGALSQSGLTHFELYPTEGLESELQSILETWQSHKMTAQTIEGYASKFLAPQLFLDTLKEESSPKGEWQEGEMLGDSDYIGRLESVFKEQAYQDQCKIIRKLRDLPAGNLASLLQEQAIAVTREQLKKAIQAELSIWMGRIFVPLSFALILTAVVCFMSAKPGWADRTDGGFDAGTGGLVCLILLFFSIIGALAWAVPFVRAKNARNKLREQGVNVQSLEVELREEAEALKRIKKAAKKTAK